MSARYADAVLKLEQAIDDARIGDNGAAQVLALVGVGRAVLAAAEELEALVELLRERLPEPERAESRGMLDPRVTVDEVLASEPCARCGVRRDEHGVTGPSDHDWVGGPA